SRQAAAIARQQRRFFICLASKGNLACFRQALGAPRISTLGTLRGSSPQGCHGPINVALITAWFCARPAHIFCNVRWKPSGKLSVAVTDYSKIQAESQLNLPLAAHDAAVGVCHISE